MKILTRFFILFFFMLFLAAPLFAQEDTEEVLTTEETAAVEEGVFFSDEGVITGDVVSLDAASGIITVKDDDADRTFSVLDGETILWRGIEDVGLANIKVGEEAEVGYYTDESGKLIASWVDVLVEEEVPPLEVDLGGEEETVIEE